MPVERSLRASLPSLGFAVAGLAVSAYLTVEHYSASKLLACPENVAINCAKVTTSAWSRLAGVPVAVLGLAFFAAMTALVVPAAWRYRALDPVRVAGATILVCTFGLFVTILWRTAVGLGTRRSIAGGPA